MNILVVDDDPSFNKMLTGFLSRNNYEVKSAHSPQSALALLKENTFDLVLTDFKLPDMNGIKLMQEIKKVHNNIPVILITNYSDIRTAVNSIKLGAYEFVTKPVIPDELLKTIQKALTVEPTQAGSSSEDKPKEKDTSLEFIVGKTPKSLELWDYVDLVAPTKMSVLILGESGTGKEYVANIIHQKSSRAAKPFVAMDCGVLSKELAASELFGHVKGAFTGAINDKKGQFEVANGGTLFLDEIGNLPYEVQVQLLRVLQESIIKRVGSEKEIPVDVRIISATNENLADNRNSEEFRNDLYHRINEFELKVPPLRERLIDLEEYCAFFMKEACRDLNKPPKILSNEVVEIFKKYDWPGNLRELKNLIKRAVLLATDEYITIDQLPEGFKQKETGTKDSAENIKSVSHQNLKEIQKSQEIEAIKRVLSETKYNKSLAAKLLNIDRSTLYKKIKEYGIDA
ncbi:sigma-54-dependent Fis family transcriptional regulator [Marivirga sp. S37H4]|uniref:Sigma-54-dependent Fis family transcriptional regulator n=1 Tax=Marivirga aurantiaca TaxID=2802615 RepID=A0A934WVT6_9BACT|nr:sigma-54 dependent transcriptional regulator [Marivirga aurantiaca]MBK6263978.1 sigma-54-dependent Fis family transcriptional regulator [Marivirga aurantiaca]